MEYADVRTKLACVTKLHVTAAWIRELWPCFAMLVDVPRRPCAAPAWGAGNKYKAGLNRERLDEAEWGGGKFAAMDLAVTRFVLRSGRYGEVGT